MAQPPFKGLTPIFISDAFYRRLQDAAKDGRLNRLLAAHPNSQPDPHEWARAGFADRPGTDLDDDNATFWSTAPAHDITVVVRIAERILPGSVVQRHLAPRLIAEAIALGHKLGREDKARVRHEVEQSLLPQAFIRTMDIPIVITPRTSENVGPMILIGSASDSKASDAWTVFNVSTWELRGESEHVEFLKTKTTKTLFGDWAHDFVLGETDTTNEDIDPRQEIRLGSNLVARHEGNKKTIRFAKAPTLLSDDVQSAVRSAQILRLEFEWFDPKAINAHNVDPFTDKAATVTMSRDLQVFGFSLHTFTWKTKGLEDIELGPYLAQYATATARTFGQCLDFLITDQLDGWQNYDEDDDDEI